MKNNKNTGLSTVGGSSIPEVLGFLNQKLENLTKITDQPYKTSGQIEGFSSIKEMTKIEQLIAMGASVAVREDAYNLYAKNVLKMDTFPVYKLSGFEKADIDADIALRIAVINHSETVTKLNELKKAATEFMSTEEKKELFLKNMENALNNL